MISADVLFLIIMGQHELLDYRITLPQGLSFGELVDYEGVSQQPDPKHRYHSSDREELK